MAPSRSRTTGFGLITAASILYATYGIWISLLGDAFGAFGQAVYRGSLVAMVMVVAAIVTKNWHQIRLSDRHTRRWLLILVIANGVIQAPMYLSVLQAGIGLSMTVGYISIVLGTYVLSWVINQEHISHRKLASLILGVGGTILVFTVSTTSVSRSGLIFAIISGLGTALDIIALQKLKLGVLQVSGLSWVAVVGTNLPFAIAFKQLGVGDISTKAWIVLGIFSIVSVGASFIHTSGLRLLAASIVGIFGLLEIAIAIAFGAILFGERVTMIQLIGVALIFIACIIPYMNRALEDTLPPEPNLR